MPKTILKESLVGLLQQCTNHKHKNKSRKERHLSVVKPTEVDRLYILSPDELGCCLMATD